jgi:cyclophilin family peptidyl-prolyl cis-trans isomerase
MPEPGRAELLRRRRRARLAGAAVVVVIVLGTFMAAGRAPREAARKDDRQEAPTLPAGCEPERAPRIRQGRLRKPRTTLEAGRDFRAVIHTSCGDISIDLLEERAPVNVANFIYLARRGFYDGLTWHRVERDALVQTGDPNGRNLDAPDGPDYRIADELDSVRGRDYVYGVVAMANAGPDTAGSQFLIVTHDHEGALEGEAEPAGLQPDYTIFGIVDRASWDELERLSAVPVRGGIDLVSAVEPVVPVYVRSIDIKASR